MQQWGVNLPGDVPGSLTRLTTTEPMIPDPKLPLARSSTGLPELQPASSAPEPQAAQNSADSQARSAAHLWLRRVGVLVFVFLCATIGVMLIILPWRPEWTD